MPTQALTLRPGVNVEATESLNQAGISSCQAVRFFPDGAGGAYTQKLGGWSAYYNSAMNSSVSALNAWADLNGISYLGVGCENTLNVITNGQLLDITPRTTSTDPVVSVSVTSGENDFFIDDTGSNISAYDTVWIKTQIAVGGVILFGLYTCIGVSADQYQINPLDNFGLPILATADATDEGDVAAFTATMGSSQVSVLLAANGYVVGQSFPVLVSTMVGGITLFGEYDIVAITDADNFIIQSGSAATADDMESMNGGDAHYEYFIGDGPLPAGTGFGVGGFGVGGFGSGVAPSANPGTPISGITSWTLDNWGSIELVNPRNDVIYQWNPLTSPPTATVIPQAPPANVGFFIAMPYRQIISYGSSFDGIVDNLLVRWCDINNFSVWLANPGNQAGSYRLTRGSKIVGGIQGPQQGLLWTDVGVWSMQYLNQPLIWGFSEIAQGCGLIAQKAAGVLGGVVYWMSYRNFYSVSGGGVQILPCPVWDVIFQNLDTTQTDKIRCAPNSEFNEVAWYFPALNGQIMYVKYNASLAPPVGWDYGGAPVQRTAWIDQSVLGSPIGAGTDNFIYQHEISNDANGSALSSTFTTGYFAISDTDVQMFVDRVLPDFKWALYGQAANATIKITFYARNYPGDTPVVHGPYSVTSTTNFITPRIRCRLLAVQISTNDVGIFWRLGDIRYRIVQAGKFG